MNIAVVTILFLVFFIAIEKAGAHYRASRETTRQIVHITSGVVTAFLPMVISFREIVVLGLIFLPIMVISKWRNVFSSIHGVQRDTLGEVYFPLAAAATAFLFPERILFMYGLFIMGVSDGLASVIGQIFNGRSYIIFSFSSRKTYLGSIVFFLVASLIGVILLSFGNVSIADALAFSVAAAGVLTLTEALLGGGLDNLILPLLASAILKTTFSAFL